MRYFFALKLGFCNEPCPMSLRNEAADTPPPAASVNRMILAALAAYNPSIL